MAAHMSVINALENTTSHTPLHFVTEPQPNFLIVTYTGFISFATPVVWYLRLSFAGLGVGLFWVVSLCWLRIFCDSPLAAVQLTLLDVLPLTSTQWHWCPPPVAVGPKPCWAHLCCTGEGLRCLGDLEQGLRGSTPSHRKGVAGRVSPSPRQVTAFIIFLP